MELQRAEVLPRLEGKKIRRMETSLEEGKDIELQGKSSMMENKIAVGERAETASSIISKGKGNQHERGDTNIRPREAKGHLHPREVGELDPYTGAKEKLRRRKGTVATHVK